jgi:hypothetical protein
VEDRLNLFGIESFVEDSSVDVSRDNFTDEKRVVTSWYCLDKFALQMSYTFFDDW